MKRLSEAAAFCEYRRVAAGQKIGCLFFRRYTASLFSLHPKGYKGKQK
jgi:hypothetical protein